MTRRTACPEEGILLRYMDGEGEGAERTGLAEHLLGCPECRDRLEALRYRATEVRRWLERHDPPPPPATAYRVPGRRRGRRAAGWAVAASVVLAGTVLATPAPQWVRGMLAPDETVEPTAPEEMDATRFEPRGPTLVLSLQSSDVARRLTIRRVSDARITIRTPGPETELLIEPGRVTVAEGDPDAAGYGIELPASVERLVVRVPGRSDRIVPNPAGSEATVVVIPGGAG